MFITFESMLKHSLFFPFVLLLAMHCKYYMVKTIMNENSDIYWQKHVLGSEIKLLIGQRTKTKLSQKHTQNLTFKQSFHFINPDFKKDFILLVTKAMQTILSLRFIS